MGLRDVAAATVLALVGSALVVSPAGAQPAPKQDGHDHYPSSIDTTVPPGYNSSLTSPTIPKKAKSFEVAIEYDDTGGTTSFEALEHYFAQPMTKTQKLLTCIGLQTKMNFDWDDVAEGYQFDQSNVPVSIIFLAACMQVAGLINLGPGSARSAAEPADTCSNDYGAIPAQLKKTKSGPRLLVDGKARAVKKPKVRVKCKATDGKVVYTFRARKKGVPVRKVLGTRLAFGVLNPADADESVSVEVTFDVP